MADRTLRVARALAAEAERWAELTAERYAAAFDSGELGVVEVVELSAAVTSAYAVASIARMFTQD